MKAAVRQEVVLRSDLRNVYRDPPYAHLLAFLPEQHASRRCERALKRGTTVPADPAALWCDSCTTDDPTRATLRLVDGLWERAA